MTKKSDVKKINGYLLETASENIGHVQRAAFGALELSMVADGDGTVRYQVSGGNAAPTMSEWEMLLANMPSKMLAEDVRHFSYKGRYYVQANLLLEAV